MPANVLIVNKVFYEVATFDLIPLDWLTDYIDSWVGDLDKNKEVYLSAQAKEISYERTNPIINLILPLFMILVTVIILLLLKIMSFCC